MPRRRSLEAETRTAAWRVFDDHVRSKAAQRSRLRSAERLCDIRGAVQRRGRDGAAGRVEAFAERRANAERVGRCHLAAAAQLEPPHRAQRRDAHKLRLVRRAAQAAEHEPRVLDTAWARRVLRRVDPADCARYIRLLRRGAAGQGAILNARCQRRNWPRKLHVRRERARRGGGGGVR